MKGILSGNSAPEMVLDLHGDSLREAKSRVLHMFANAGGTTRFRIITGRGNHININGSRTVLFNSFKSWVEDTAFAERIQQVKQFDGYFELNL